MHASNPERIYSAGSGDWTQARLITVSGSAHTVPMSNIDRQCMGTKLYCHRCQRQISCHNVKVTTKYVQDKVAQSFVLVNEVYCCDDVWRCSIWRVQLSCHWAEQHDGQLEPWRSRPDHDTSTADTTAFKHTRTSQRSTL